MSTGSSARVTSWGGLTCALSGLCLLSCGLLTCVASPPLQSPAGDLGGPAPSQASLPNAPASEPPGKAAAPADVPPRVEARPGPDVQATRAARATLQRKLLQLAASPRIALGHEDTTAYGVGWSGDADRSDVKDLCGSHVAVYGWDIFGVEKGAAKNGDGVDFEHMRRLIADAHRRGGINTISWHLDNPVTGGNAWDKRRAIHAILPGQPRHALYQSYLDAAARYLHGLRGDSDELIPIIFRPFHEHTGSWFWWGRAHTNDADFVALWRYTIDYLRYEHGLENLLFAFSPGGGEVTSDADYLYRYPGDAYVDVFGVDHYYGNDTSLVRLAEVVVRVAESRGKIPAITEFGARGGLNGRGIGSNWIVQRLLEPLEKSPLASRVAYALAWRNASAEHCFLPYPGHPGAAGFKSFCDHERIILENDLARLR